MVVQSLDRLFASRNGSAVIRRLRWIDGRLRWLSAFRRSELVSLFRISPQQASTDIANYQAAAPGNARLDLNDRTYRREVGFEALFPGDALSWLSSAVEAGDRAVIPMEQLVMPCRQARDATMEAVFEAYRARAGLIINYQSLSSPERSERVICPHHIVDTGDRLHLRAWDDRRRVFTDFVVGRIGSARLKPDYPWVDEIADGEWLEFVNVELGPQDGLTASQRIAIEMEFGMQRGRVVVPVRKAMLAYLLDRLGLLDSVKDPDGQTQPGYGTMCLNPGELRPLLTGWQRKGRVAYRD